jgi:hypothetical protein
MAQYYSNEDLVKQRLTFESFDFYFDDFGGQLQGN